MNFLEQLKRQSKVVADSGDFESVKRFRPVDATTNPSLIYSAAKDPKYASLINDAITFAKYRSANKQTQLNLALDRLIIRFGLEILKIVPGRVSTEVDARLSYDTPGTVKKAEELIGYYHDAGIDKNRVLIKIAATWEGIKAAEILTREGIHCNMTLLFSMNQAISCADAGVQLVSPFVGRILDWYQKNNTSSKEITPEDEPGVLLVKEIYAYYKRLGYKTEIMAASFRNMGEIIELSGCDLLTISPPLLNQLEQTEGTLERKLQSKNTKENTIKKVALDENKFWWLMNEDAMATEKLAEGIKKFTEDIIKLEKLLEKELLGLPTKPLHTF